jgi:hypothetical protein
MSDDKRTQCDPVLRGPEGENDEDDFESVEKDGFEGDGERVAVEGSSLRRLVGRSERSALLPAQRGKQPVKRFIRRFLKDFGRLRRDPRFTAFFSATQT